VSISVLLADDQPLLRRGLRMIIEAQDQVRERQARKPHGQSPATMPAIVV
jgi:DNA-binding NarL/FixJ family response regulator